MDKITTSSEELQFHSLMNGNNILEVPLFQRDYTWKESQVKTLIEDIDEINDGEKSLHFMGALILHTSAKHKSFGNPDKSEVIDGQQRITTLFLIICAAVKWLIENGHFKEAKDIIGDYLLNIKSDDIPNSKLYPGINDRKQLNTIFRLIFKGKKFEDYITKHHFRYVPLEEETSSSLEGKMRKNFNLALRHFKELVRECEAHEQSKDVITKFVATTVRNLNFVTLIVIDKTAGPQIFNRLNDKQSKMSISDLIRNGIISKVPDQSPNVLKRLNVDHWRPFETAFPTAASFNGFFFPYGLILEPELKKDNTWNVLETKWSKLSAENIIEELTEYQKYYLCLTEKGECKIGSSDFQSSVAKLNSLVPPRSTLPFLMALMQKVEIGSYADQDGCKLLHACEAYFVRRNICGHAQSGLHAVFKRLWADVEDQSVSNFMKKIAGTGTKCPTDEEFRKSIIEGNMYNRPIKRYFIREYEISLGGDLPDYEFQIEHLLPKTLTPQWKKMFSVEDHEKTVNTAANLIPLKAKMNNSIGQNSYIEKKSVIEEGSCYQSSRKLFSEYREWNPESLNDRAQKLADWALDRWSFNI